MHKSNPLFCFPFFLSLGIFLTSYIPVLFPIWLLIGLVFLSIFLIRQRKSYCLSLIIGLIYGALYAHWIVSQQLPKEFDNLVFVVHGKIVDLPQKNKSGYRFKLKVNYIEALETTAARLDTARLKQLENKLLSLSWRSYHSSHHRHSNKFTESITNIPLLKNGDYWQLEVKLRRPRGFVNPFGFDYQLYLLQNKIVATGYVKNNHKNYLLENQCDLVSPDCARQEISTLLEDNKNAFYFSGLVKALLIGDKQGISDELWEVLRDTGTIHLLAISGLHIGLAAFFGFFLGRLIVSVFNMLLAILFKRSISTLWQLPSLFSILFSVLYGLLSGFTLPTQRALIMVVLFHIFLLTKRTISPWILVAAALSAIAIINPLSVRSQGFWMSFLAVAVLLFVFNRYLPHSTNGKESNAFKFKSLVLTTIKAQWLITIGLFVPGILLLNGFSLSAPLANVVAIPFISFITVPLLMIALGSLFFSKSIALFFLQISDSSLQLLMVYLKVLQSSFGQFLTFDFGPISPLAIVIACLGVIVLLLPRGFPFRYLGVLCFLPLFFLDQHKSDLEITFLDVGQGTAVVIRTPDYQLVYDMGKKYSNRFNVGEHIIAPFLLGLGHKNIDTIITSHSDSDHAGGLEGLVNLINVRHHLSGEPNETEGEQCYAGQHWQWNQSSFKILWPQRDYVERLGPRAKSNNLSCVLLIESGSYRILLSGDIEKVIEMQLISLYPELLSNIDVVLIPHHGSKTSSHRAWIKHLNPDFAIVTAGFTNAYGHPHPDVIARYSGISSVENTASSGAIRFAIDADNLRMYRWREFKPRYWYD